MVDIISGLFVLAIFLAFVTPWIRSIAQRNRRPVAGRSTPRGPRDLAESGGYLRTPPAGREPSIRLPKAERSSEEEVSVLRKPSTNAPVNAVSPQGRDARVVRRALATPESLRTAILLKEIIDPPVSMKDHGR